MVFQQEVRKGPWTEQEDLKLVSFVGLFGDRRWDFIAKVSGLNRTGKSCRLRWVNYLHPGLKRGKMTPQEERLVLELQSKWGNRWSRIARKLPGRTDNEIKNYWRTHMRKKAQDLKKKGAVPSPPSSPSSGHSSNNIHSVVLNSHAASKEGGEESFYDTGGPNNSTQVVIKVGGGEGHEGGDKQELSMDDIWRDIDLSEENSTLQLVYDGHSTEEGCNSNFPSCPPPMLHSPSSWEYSTSDSLWVMGEESMLFPMSDPYSFSSYAQASAFLTG